MKSWKTCRKILCIRADNMGDVLMSGPAIRALKENFDCSITLLTSLMGAIISSCLMHVDEVLSYNLPWIKANGTLPAEECAGLIAEIKAKKFDAAVIFTAYSQSALPAAMLCFFAGIPMRLAYCRENPYELLTHWVPDKEPFTEILHQVTRDCNLVKSIGADISDEGLHVKISEKARQHCARKLFERGININHPYFVVHTGVSEAKREYPVALWVQAIRELHHEFDIPVLLTGSIAEKAKVARIHEASGGRAYNIAGLLEIDEFVALINEAEMVVSVNTSTVHIAAATQTPVVVLYATTNPQHTPWKVPSRVLYFPVDQQLRSRNEVISYVSNLLYGKPVPFPMPADIVQAVKALSMKTQVIARSG